jgi:hypothetical protein
MLPLIDKLDVIILFFDNISSPARQVPVEVLNCIPQYSDPNSLSFE